MPPTRGKKRSSRDTQKQNVNEPREGATRVVTVASGHQKGQKKMQKLACANKLFSILSGPPGGEFYR